MCIHCTYTCRQINTPSQSPNKMGVKMKSNFQITKHFQIAAKSPSQPVFYSKLLHKCPPPAPTPVTNSYLRPKNISRLSLQVFHQKWAPWKARNAPEITISASWNGEYMGQSLHGLQFSFLCHIVEARQVYTYQIQCTVCPEMHGNEIHVPHNRHHKVSLLMKSHQNTPNYIKYEVYENV